MWIADAAAVKTQVQRPPRMPRENEDDVALSTDNQQPAVTGPSRSEIMRVGRPAEELALAERDLRGALASEPGLIEARIRLAHVLSALGRKAEAAEQARRTPDTRLPPFLDYYGAMVLGRAEADLGRQAEARVAFERAARLLPMSQSPRVALSRLAVIDGHAADGVATLIATSGPEAKGAGIDPWWSYLPPPRARRESAADDVQGGRAMRLGARTMRRVALVVAIGGQALATPGPASAQNAEADRLQHLSVRRDVWAEAVAAHEPGVVDDAVQTILTMDESLIEAGLKRALVETGRLPRALALHTDAAIIDPQGESGGLPPSRLLEDGRLVGLQRRSRQWRFATQIAIALARVVPSPAATADGVAAAHRLSALWFRTIAVMSLRRGELGLADGTLGWALRLFPDDAALRLVNGTLHQAYADPRVQRFSGRERMAPMGLLVEPRTRSERPPTVLGPQSEKGELSLAEASLRRALELQPTLREARVRLAHVLTERGGADVEAASLAGAALEGGLPPYFEAYALLILGRSCARLGRLDDARAAFTRAAALTPAAQAPRIGLAQVALAEGKPAIGLAQLAAVSDPERTPPPETEDWRGFFRVHEPDAQALLTELWEGVR